MRVPYSSLVGQPCTRPKPKRVVRPGDAIVPLPSPPPPQQTNDTRAATAVALVGPAADSPIDRASRVSPRSSTRRPSPRRPDRRPRWTDPPRRPRWRRGDAWAHGRAAAAEARHTRPEPIVGRPLAAALLSNRCSCRATPGYPPGPPRPFGGDDRRRDAPRRGKMKILDRIERPPPCGVGPAVPPAARFRPDHHFERSPRQLRSLGPSTTAGSVRSGRGDDDE